MTACEPPKHVWDFPDPQDGNVVRCPCGEVAMRVRSGTDAEGEQWWAIEPAEAPTLGQVFAKQGVPIGDVHVEALVPNY